MSLIVVDAVGPATSVQDAGRSGAQRYGLTTSGAMDRVSLAIANALVGQPCGSAAIEIGPLGAAVTARRGDVRVSLAGADRAARVDKRRGRWSRSWINETLFIAEGETLTLDPARSSVFSYLGIEGGIAGEPVYGSLSVSARAGLGSPYPRPLRPGDKLEVGTARDGVPDRRFKLEPAGREPIRVVLGPQDDHMTPEAVALFLATEWRVSPKSDRMGYRLEGPKLAHADGYNIVSDGTVPGSIQIPGNGQPLALLADRGTTGGYPKIATIITADLSRFAQTQAGGRVRFAAIPIEEAQLLARGFAAKLAQTSERVETLVKGVPAGDTPFRSDLDPRSWHDAVPSRKSI
ncbi:MAG: biotin-dependent carboxyltransferase family protein [Hyphomicrobiales bacterium]